MAAPLTPGDATAANTTGLLTIAKPITLTGGSAFKLEINGTTAGATTSTGYDQLALTSATGPTLSGAAISVTLGFAPAPNTAFTVINNTNSAATFSGAFSNLAQNGTITASYNSTTYTFVGNYLGGDGNDLVLTTTPEPTGLVGAGIAFGVMGMRRRKNRTLPTC